MTLEERFANLRAIIMEQAETDEDEEVILTAVKCDGCGKVEEAATIEKLKEKVSSWKLGGFREEADFCPSCSLMR